MTQSETAFLRGSDVFGNQPDTVLETLVSQGVFAQFGPGDIVFRQGREGDQLCIVKTGVLEILSQDEEAEAHVIAYLGPGEVLGELALLTGSPRSATVRSPERAELFVLEKERFHELLATQPDFARGLCVVLARRLEATTLKVPRTAGKQLQGNLAFFDLATVIQTLIGAHQTGSLVVSESGGHRRVAEIFFYKGNIARARYRQLRGDDAVFQLFQGALEGEFSFAGRSVPEEEVHADVTLPAISLLMESVRMQDELPTLRERLPDWERPFHAKVEELSWPEEESVEVAAAVWARVRHGASLADLHREIPRCSYSLYRTVATLVETGQVG